MTFSEDEDEIDENPVGDLDLDVDTPENVPGVLRAAAQEYLESELELEGAWQDKQAGKVWAKIAKILERAADQIDKLL